MARFIQRGRAWLGRRSALLLLLLTASGLAAGGLAHLAGAGAVADAAWLATAAVGIGCALWSAADSILHGRLGVDVIALLAVAGAVAVGELLAAAVISVMLTSGRFLEAWAAERARHDLNALLARAPRIARRYRGGRWRRCRWRRSRSAMCCWWRRGTCCPWTVPWARVARSWMSPR